MTERTIAAVFREHHTADAALRALLAAGVPRRDASLAPAAIAEADDGPIRQPVTLVAVRVPADGSPAREILELHGGRVVADVPMAPAGSATAEPPAPHLAAPPPEAADEHLRLLPDGGGRRAPGLGLG